jgi:hypothetical protein
MTEEWRKLHKNIFIIGIRVSQSDRINWAGHVAHMGRREISGKPEGRRRGENKVNVYLQGH